MYNKQIGGELQLQLSTYLFIYGLSCVILLGQELGDRQAP